MNIDHGETSVTRTAREWVRRLPPRECERGSGALEYTGIVALASILVVATVGAVSTSSAPLVDEVWARICQIMGGGCSAAKAPGAQAYKPPACDVSRSENEISGVVDVAFARVGGSGAIQRIEKSDGSIEISLLNSGRGGAVAYAGGGADLRFGGKKLSAEAEAEAALTGGYSTSETWVFKDRAKAEKFESYLQRELGEDVLAGANPVVGATNGFVEWVTRESAPANGGVRKTLVRFDLTGEASARGGLGYGTGGEAAARAMVALGAEFDVGDKSDDPSDDMRTDFYQVDWRVAAQANLPVVAGWDGAHASSGIVTVTRNARNEPVKVEILDESAATSQFMVIGTDGSITPADPAFDPRKAGHKEWDVLLQGGPNHSVVVRQELILDGPARRGAFEQWFGAARGIGTAALQAVPGVDAKGRAAGGGAFERYLRDRARVSIVEYDGTTWGLGGGARVGLGFKAGVDAGFEHRETKAVKAYYLGAPAQGEGREPVGFPECAPR